MLHVDILGRRRPDLTHDQFTASWGDVHAQILHEPAGRSAIRASLRPMKDHHEIMPTHAVIWIDHKEARIFHVHPEASDETAVLAPQHHLHRPSGRPGGGKRTPGRGASILRRGRANTRRRRCHPHRRTVVTVPNWLASWCGPRTAICSVMSVALRASSSRSPRRNRLTIRELSSLRRPTEQRSSASTVVGTRREGGRQRPQLLEPAKAPLFETLTKPWRTYQ